MSLNIFYINVVTFMRVKDHKIPYAITVFYKLYVIYRVFIACALYLIYHILELVNRNKRWIPDNNFDF